MRHPTMHSGRQIETLAQSRSLLNIDVCGFVAICFDTSAIPCSTTTLILAASKTVRLKTCPTLLFSRIPLCVGRCSDLYGCAEGQAFETRESSRIEEGSASGVGLGGAHLIARLRDSHLISNPVVSSASWLRSLNICFCCFVFVGGGAHPHGSQACAQWGVSSGTSTTACHAWGSFQSAECTPRGVGSTVQVSPAQATRVITSTSMKMPSTACGGDPGNLAKPT